MTADNKTLRDEFAMAALTGFISGKADEDNYFQKYWISELPAIVYQYADAMLAARKEQP